jgi:CheY-like chemotaxis protein
LIVDDDPILSKILDSAMRSIGYETTTASNGLEALQILGDEDHGIQAIISDVMMPEMNGYDLCQQIRDMPQLCHLPFIFISGKSTLEEKLKGFGVGGDEYITKPLKINEATLKIQRTVDNKLSKLNLNQQLQDSSAVAFQAMTYSSQLGNILEFLQKALQAASHEDLANLVFEVTTSLNLRCNLQFHTSQGILDLAQGSMVSPLESNIVEMTRAKGRYFDFGPRTIINYDDFSLLIKNMPVEDSEAYGQLKDLLGSFCNAIDAAVKLLNSSSKLESKDDLINTVNNAINEVSRTFKVVQDDTEAAISHMMEEMEEAMLTQLGLSEAQEETIRSIVLEMQGRTSKNFGHIEVVQRKLESILQALKNASQ